MLRVLTMIYNASLLNYRPPFMETLSKALELYVAYVKGTPPAWSKLHYHRVDQHNVLNDIFVLNSKYGFDAVYALDGIFYETIAYRLWRKLKIPYVIRLRTNELMLRKVLGEFPLRTWFWHQTHKFVLRHASAISCISHALLVYSKRVTKNKVPVKLIYHGVDANVFKRTQSHKLDNLLTVGLRKYKGADLVLEIARSLPHINLLIVGVAEDRYVRQAPPNVIHLGRIMHRDMPRVYEKAFLTLLPSLTEGLPNTILESMACETPVIASAVGEIPHVLKPDIGIVLRSWRASDWIGKINELLSDVDRVKEMGKRARNYVVKNFTWGKYVEDTRTLLENVVKK